MDYRFYTGYLTRTSILIILFYANYIYLIEKFLFNRNFLKYIALNIVLTIILLFLQNTLIDFFMQPNHSAPIIHMNKIEDRPPMGGGGPSLMRLWGDYMFIILVIGMSVGMKATIRWFKDSINYEKVKATQLEADLRNLRNQMNPHFLFNTLNNIYSLIGTDANKAQESVHRLSGLLRYVLYDNDQKFVSIAKELEFTRNYIDLMRLRLSPKIKVDVLISYDDDNKNQIASLMFITLIENAFKHGINNEEHCFIDIKILVEKDNGVLCTVENSLNNVIENSSNNIESRNSGIGLVNLSKRLDLLYPDNHEFVAEKRTNSFFAMLRINFDKNKTAET